MAVFACIRAVALAVVFGAGVGVGAKVGVVQLLVLKRLFINDQLGFFILAVSLLLRLKKRARVLVSKGRVVGELEEKVEVIVAGGGGGGGTRRGRKGWI